MARPARVSPDRILAAAAAEFAARGWAGARVDRIARRARVNKAMLYYHFRSKQGLYRALLRQTFRSAGEQLQAIAEVDLPPADKIDRAIAVMAAFIREHAFFPAIMLRELAEGGARLDRETLAMLATVPRAVGAIVEQGMARKAFRPVHPLAAYFTMLAPIVVYLAGAPIRKELTAQHLVDASALTPDAFIRHVQETMRRALACDPSTLQPFDPSTLRPFDKLRVVPSPVEGRQAQGRPEPGRGTKGSTGSGSSRARSRDDDGASTRATS